MSPPASARNATPASKGSEVPKRAIALRCDFVSEAIQVHLLALGHQLANLSFRFFLTSRTALDAVSNNKSLRDAATAAVPWTDNPQAWLFQSQLELLRGELAGSSIERAKVVRAGARLNRTVPWKDLTSMRGRSLHRWREDVGGLRSSGFATMKGRHEVSSGVVSRDRRSCLGVLSSMGPGSARTCVRVWVWGWTRQWGPGGPHRSSSSRSCRFVSYGWTMTVPDAVPAQPPVMFACVWQRITMAASPPTL